MWTCKPPVADMLHLMTQVLDTPASWSALPAFDGLDGDTTREVLEQAARFARDVLAPTNAPGDLAGCTWSPAGVSTPPGFRQAYAAFVDGGELAVAVAVDEDGARNLGRGLGRLQPFTEVVAGRSRHRQVLRPHLRKSRFLSGLYAVARGRCLDAGWRNRTRDDHLQ